VLPTVSPGPEDFVTFGGLARRVLVTRDFVQQRDEGGCCEHESRSYFVHDLWTFQGARSCPRTR
jgi:hypothetical protein